MRPFICLLLILLALQSCTIEKRRYTGGFHVEWNHRTSHKTDIKTNDDLATIVSDPSEETGLPDTTAIQTSNTEKVLVSLESPKRPVARLTQAKNAVMHAAVPQRFTQILSERFSKSQTDPVVEVPNINSKRSLLFGLLTWFLVGLQIYFSTTLVVAMAALTITLFVLQLVFALMAVIFGNLGIKESETNPGKFNNRWASVVGSALGLAYLILIALTIFLILFVILLFA